MRDFTYLVNDDRQAGPMLRRVRMRDEIDAREMAERIFRETAHHLGVEVWEKDERLYVVGRPGGAPPAQSPP